jgi:hypothetical protein
MRTRADLEVFVKMMQMRKEPMAVSVTSTVRMKGRRVSCISFTIGRLKRNNFFQSD